MVKITKFELYIYVYKQHKIKKSKIHLEGLYLHIFSEPKINI
jgi:hypothetical protein